MRQRGSSFLSRYDNEASTFVNEILWYTCCSFAASGTIAHTVIVLCVARARPLCVCVRWAISATDCWAALGIEPRTSRTQRVNHTTKPSSQLQTLQVCWVPDVAASTAFVVALSSKAEHCELDNSVVVTWKKLSTMTRQRGRFVARVQLFRWVALCRVPPRTFTKSVFWRGIIGFVRSQWERR